MMLEDNIRPILFLLAVTVIGRVDADYMTSMYNYYTELGCSAIVSSNGPSEFDCTSSIREPNRCYVKGNSYNISTTIDFQDSSNPCIVQCICQSDGKQTYFQCTQVDCPESFEEYPPPNCYRQHAQGVCCSTGIRCVNATSSSAQTATSPMTCKYQDQSYEIGQKFFPPNQPCKVCICQEGYDGTLDGPWCTQLSCSLDLHYGDKIASGCAPVFFDSVTCCPITWRCPVAGDTIIPSTTQMRSLLPPPFVYGWYTILKVLTTTTEKPTTIKPSTTIEPTSTADMRSMCIFGSLRVKVEFLTNTDDNCVQCVCLYPPHLTCTQKYPC